MTIFFATLFSFLTTTILVAVQYLFGTAVYRLVPKLLRCYNGTATVLLAVLLVANGLYCSEISILCM
jgi:hypothetical protein